MDQNDLVNAFTLAINAACAPNGAITNALNRGINAACAPNGAFTNAITASSNLSDQRIVARLANDRASRSNGSLIPLPAQVYGNFPPEFPRSTQELRKMTQPVATALLLFYGLPAEQSVVAARRTLAYHCNVHL